MGVRGSIGEARRDKLIYLATEFVFYRPLLAVPGPMDPAGYA